MKKHKMVSIRNDIDDEEVRFMHESEGWSYQKIADYYGVSRGCIYWRLNPDKKKEANKEWMKEHPEYKNQWYIEHPEYNKEWRIEHPEYDKERYDNNKESMLEQVKEYQQTENGKATIRRHNAKRRELGSIELNKPFDNSEGHHIDETYIIHIPKELHRSIYNNVYSGEGMEAINTIAFGYITEEVFDKLLMGEIR